MTGSPKQLQKHRYQDTGWTWRSPSLIAWWDGKSRRRKTCHEFAGLGYFSWQTILRPTGETLEGYLVHSLPKAGSKNPPWKKILWMQPTGVSSTLWRLPLGLSDIGYWPWNKSSQALGVRYSTWINLNMNFETIHRNQNLPLPAKSEIYQGDLTYYAPGLGACGITSTDGDNICAVSHIIFDTVSNGSNPNTNPLCGLKIRATRYDERVNAQRSLDLTVVDRCMPLIYIILANRKLNVRF